MTEAIDGKNLVYRHNRYGEYRRMVDQAGSSFTEKLAEAEGQDQDQGSQTRASREAGGGRRGAPRVSNRSQKITIKQARRLAGYAPIIERCAKKYDVPVELICGVILQESGGNARATSHCGARGLMQLMPATARRFGVRNSFDPAQNIEGGTRYLRWLLNRFDGKVELALAGYNAGEHNVEKHGNKIPPFKETQNYVPAVLSYTQSMIEIFLARSQGQQLDSRLQRA